MRASLPILDGRTAVPGVDRVLAVGMLGLALRATTSPTLAGSGMAVGLIYLAAAAGFWRRAPALGPVARPALLAAVPGVVVGAVALGLAGPLSAWSVPARLVFVLGALGAAASAWSLRRCFGVLPAHRGLVTDGPYAWVRHPMYASQLCMIGGCAAALGGWKGVGLWVCSGVAIALRTGVEERVLARDPGWVAYRQRVRWWWVPGVI